MVRQAFCGPVSSIHATSNTLIFLALHARSHVSGAYAQFMTLAVPLMVGALPAGRKYTALTVKESALTLALPVAPTPWDKLTVAHAHVCLPHIFIYMCVCLCVSVCACVEIAFSFVLINNAVV